MRASEQRTKRPAFRTAKAFAGAIGLAALCGFTTGCRNDMHDQPRAEVGEASDFFEDGSTSREQPPGTIAVGHNDHTNPHLFTGRINGELATTYPFPIGITELKKGQERYNIYCSVCHGHDGTSNGMVVQRGFVRPPNIVEDPRLKASPPGHFFEVISNGWGAMFSYNDRISVEDRWKIAAYVQVLQASEATDVAQLSPEDREKVNNAKKLADLIEDERAKEHGGSLHAESETEGHNAPDESKGEQHK